MQTDSASKKSRRNLSTVHESRFCYPDWHGDLCSVRPSCLWRTPAFTCVSRVYFSCPGDTVPESPAVLLQTLWRVKVGSSPSLSKKGNQVMPEKLGEEREVSRLLCHCFAHSCHTSHGQDSAHGSKGHGSCSSKAEFQFWWSQNENALTTLFFKKWLYFSSKNIQRHWLKPRCISFFNLSCL